MVKVTAERIHMPQGGVVVHFKGEVNGTDVEKLPVVCLSRVKPGQCNYQVDELQNHDGHSPLHQTIEEANAYIERVLKDIQDGLASQEIILETDKVDLKALFIPSHTPPMPGDTLGGGGKN